MTDARTRLERADHGVLSTLHPTRGIDSVPVCFVVAGDVVGIPIDTVKPKRSTRLGRLRNLEADPRATLLVEHWDADDWTALWWVRVSVLLTEVDASQLAELTALLLAKYAQYENGGIESVVASAARRAHQLGCGLVTPPRLGPMKRAIALTLVAVAASTFLFAACSDDSDSLSGDVEQLCSDVSALNSTIQSVAGQDIDLKATSVTQVKSTLADIQSQVDAITNAGSEVSDQVKSDLANAYDQLKSDLADVTNSDTPRAGRTADRDRPHQLPRRMGRHPRRAQLLGHHHRLTDTVGVP